MGKVCGQAAWPIFGGTAHREKFCASQKGKNLEKKIMMQDESSDQRSDPICLACALEEK